jgi:condensin complex subunit 3
MTNLRSAIAQLLGQCQKTFASHKKCLKAMRKLLAKDPQQFAKEFIPLLNKILLIFKREPAVERLIQFIITFSTIRDDESTSEEFGLALITYLLQYTNAKDKAVRFRSCQIIAGIVHSMSDEVELRLEYSYSIITFQVILFGTIFWIKCWFEQGIKFPSFVAK